MIKRSCLVSLVFAAATVSFGSSTRAQSGIVEYVSQTRYVQAQGYGPSGLVSDALYAGDFSPFDKILVVGSYAHGKAEQHSLLGTSQISASGFATGSHYIQALNGAGKSYLFVQLKIQESVDFFFTGIVNGNGWGEASLIGPDVSIKYASWFGSPGPHDFVEVGRLLPGTYTLQAFAAGSGYNAMWSDWGSYNITLNVAPICYADCDKSSTLDIDDFICFQTLYALMHPQADCDIDGQFTIDDFICFQTLFAIGC